MEMRYGSLLSRNLF